MGLVRYRSLLVIFAAGCFLIPNIIRAEESAYDFFVADPNKISIHWKSETGQRFGSINKLKNSKFAQDQQLAFATNAGIFERGYVPLGLYIENGEVLIPLNLKQGEGNFYLQPNAVFYIDDSGAHVVVAKDFVLHDKISMATQSGPYLLKDNQVNPLFKKDSDNKLIRSGVGIMPDGKAVFVISNSKINFYDFAEIFRRELKCKDAMFLDGVISKMYLPASKRYEQNGVFAGIIAVAK